MSTPASPHPRVLVAEDDDTLRDMLVTLLQMEHYITDGAASLKEACEKVEHELYNLVLTDLFSLFPPRLEAVRCLQQSCRPTPVGILSGWRINQEEAERAGFAFVLQKAWEP